MYKHELTVLLYPIFVHLYLELVLGGHSEKVRQFYSKHHKKQESYYEEELTLLKSLTTPEQLHSSDLIDMYRKNKFTTRMSRDSIQSLWKHLQVNQHHDILNIINRYIQIDVYDGMPRSHLDISKTIGSMMGEASIKVNKTKVLYGIPRDPDITAALAELEKEEADAANEDDKPKKKKTKKEQGMFSGKKAKAISTPNAPPLNRIPLPVLRDSEQTAKFQAFKDAAKCISLSSSSLPSICFYTLINTSNGLNTVTISKDSSLLAGGFANSTIRVWTLTPKKLCPLKTPAQMQQVTLAAEDVMERIVDISSSSDVRTLTGHSGPVYSISFNIDNTFLCSASEDSTIRLWSLQTFTALVCFKGHNYPVWGVEFSPLGYYFVSCSNDRTARLWTTEHIIPARIFAGHSSDVDCCKFHPNGNYIATGSCDRSVRVWDILNGNCVRIFTGHKGAIYTLAFSCDGKYLASAGSDKQIFIWDIDTSSQVRGLTGHTDVVYQLEFSKDNSILASGGLDKCIKLWDVSRLDDDKLGHECLLGSYPTKATPIQCLHFTRKNLLLAAGPFI